MSYFALKLSAFCFGQMCKEKLFVGVITDYLLLTVLCTVDSPRHFHLHISSL